MRCPVAVTSSLKVGSTEQAVVVRVQERGTMKESPTLQNFVRETLKQSEMKVVLSLHDCSYLDSTFLGCMAGLYKQFSRENPPRFTVSCPNTLSNKMLAPMRLDQFLHVTSDEPQCQSEWVDLPSDDIDSHCWGLHVMECHRRLSQFDSPHAATFGRIADKLEHELSTHEVDGPRQA